MLAQTLKLNPLKPYTPNTPKAVQGWAKIRRYFAAGNTVLPHCHAIRLAPCKVVHNLIQAGALYKV